MAWNIYHIDASPFATNNISNYVIEDLSIPIYKGNDNLAPVIHGFTIIISQSCPYTLSLGDQIRLTGPSISQYFDIVKIKDNRFDRSLIIYCEHRLRILRNYKLNYDNLNQLITATADQNEYCPSDNRGAGYENVNLLWALECMFTAAGLTCTFTDATDTAITIDATDFAFNTILLDYKMFYQIGQSLSQTNDPDEQITFWDFIQAVCSFWGFTFWEDDGTIKMLSKSSLTDVTTNIGYNDNYLDNYSEEESESKGLVAMANVIWADSVNNYYPSIGSDVSCGTSLTYGEIVRNGDFNFSTFWSIGAGWSIGSGKASAAGSTADLAQDINAKTGHTYKVTFTISNYSAGTVRCVIGGGVGATRNTNGTYEEYILCTSAGNFRFDALTAFTGDIDNVSVIRMDDANVNWFTNLRFLIHNTGGSDGDVYVSANGIDYTDFVNNDGGLVSNMLRDSIENDYVEKNYELFENSELLSGIYLANEVAVNPATHTLKINVKEF